MLRHLAYGWRNFHQDPDLGMTRLNWEFFAVIKGQCAPHFTGEPLPSLKSSTLWLVPPQTSYLWSSWSRPCQRAMFQVADVPELLTKALQGRPCHEVPINAAQGERILQLADAIRPFYYHPDETYELRTSHLVSELCLMILGETKFTEDVPLHLVALQRVQKAEAFYRENLRRKPTLREVAMEAGISESQLRRHFQKIRYAPPEEIFRTLRLHEACQLLLNTSLTNDLVASQTGFGSTIDFHRSFKTKFGVTPHYWRTHTKMDDTRLDFRAGICRGWGMCHLWRGRSKAARIVGRVAIGGILTPLHEDLHSCLSLRKTPPGPGRRHPGLRRGGNTDGHRLPGHHEAHLR